jgi:pimeloyl-ACP methyl ester carboxylesterase
MSTNYLELEHGKIAYDDSGSGPLVVGVPSMGDLRDEYRFLIPQLVNAGYRVVNMDVRGMGETSVEWDDYTVAGIGADIVALIRELEAGPAIVIGTSMAAGAAVWAAAEAPELVRGMVLVGPFVRGEGTWFSNLLYSTLFTRPWGATMWLKYFSTLYPTRKPEDYAEYTSV